MKLAVGVLAIACGMVAYTNATKNQKLAGIFLIIAVVLGLATWLI